MGDGVPAEEQLGAGAPEEDVAAVVEAAEVGAHAHELDGAVQLAGEGEEVGVFDGLEVGLILAERGEGLVLLKPGDEAEASDLAEEVLDGVRAGDAGEGGAVAVEQVIEPEVQEGVCQLLAAEGVEGRLVGVFFAGIVEEAAERVGGEAAEEGLDVAAPPRRLGEGLEVVAEGGAVADGLAEVDVEGEGALGESRFSEVNAAEDEGGGVALDEVGEGGGRGLAPGVEEVALGFGALGGEGEGVEEAAGLVAGGVGGRGAGEVAEGFEGLRGVHGVWWAGR